MGKPAPPPKPSHLSSAFTGTLNSEALKSYIRQQSQTTVSRFHTLHDVEFVSHKQSPSSSASSSSSSLNFDTFRTTRPFASLTSPLDSAQNDTPEPDWGTAKQSLATTTQAKPALVDLFSPPTHEYASAVERNAKGLTISGIQAHADDEDENPSVGTIRPKLKEISMNRRRSSTDSSPLSTLRSRQPSILSRLSSFEDDEEEEEATMQADRPGHLTDGASNNVDATSPSRKGWMHARDGSAFERASPRVNGGSKIGGQSNGFVRTYGKSSTPSAIRTGLPSISDGLPILVAGPPPVRPKSITLAGDAQANVFERRSKEVTKAMPAVKRKQDRGKGRQARALYGFDGERSFNELSLKPGQIFEILKEDVQDGWSLALAEQNGDWIKGLVPQGWYTYVQEFTASPLHKAAKDAEKDYEVSSSITLGGGEGSRVLDVDQSLNDKTNASDDGQHLAITIEEQSKIRPASGVGKMSARPDDANGAKQLLSQISVSASPAKEDGPSYDCRASKIQHRDSVAEALTMPETPQSESSFEMNTETEASAVADTTVSSVASSASKLWRPPGLLGGRSLNRYAPYVLSGAEQYILSNDDERNSVAQTHVNATFKIVNEAGGDRDGSMWEADSREIVVEVHSPEAHVDERDREYTAYAVHSSYVEHESGMTESMARKRDTLFDPYVRPDRPTYVSNVYRRYNQFRWLAMHVQRYYPSIALVIAPLPNASHGAGRSVRFEAQFVERRRRHLQSWLTSIVRHPVLSRDTGLLFFLASEEEGEDWTWKAKELQRKMRYRDVVSSSCHLFARTLHPEFNVDVHELTAEAAQIKRFAEVYERSMTDAGTGVLDCVRDTRQKAVEGGDAYRQLSLALLRLITGTASTCSTVPQTASTHHTHDDRRSNGGQHGVLPPMGNVGKRDASGATNEDRAWCWREGCAECRRTTQAMQVTGAALQRVADHYRSHGQTGLFDIHDRMWNLSRAQHATTSLLDVQKNTLAMYAAATASLESTTSAGGPPPSNESTSDPTAERIAARCETVLNVTMGELDRVHGDRVQQWNALSRQLLDEMIGFHAETLSGLQAARQRVDEVLRQDDNVRGPILPSPYEDQLGKPLSPATLEMPSMTLIEPSAAAKAIHPVAFASEMLSDWLGGVHVMR